MPAGDEGRHNGAVREHRAPVFLPGLPYSVIFPENAAESLLYFRNGCDRSRAARGSGKIDLCEKGKINIAAVSLRRFRINSENSSSNRLRRVTFCSKAEW